LQISCDIRHDAAYDPVSTVGLYFGQRTYSGPDGIEYWDLTLTFNGLSDAPVAIPVKMNSGSELRWAVEYFRELAAPRRGAIPRRISLPKAAAGPPDWIPVKLLISPKRVEVECLEQTEYATRAEIQEKVRLLCQTGKRATDVGWRFDPRASMGFYVHLGQASFRNLVIEPLVAGD